MVSLGESVGALVGEYPLRFAGGFGAVAGAAVMARSLGQGGSLAAVTADEVVAFAASHPAYPALVVAGLLALLFLDG